MNDGTEAERVRRAAQGLEPPRWHTEGAPPPPTPEERRRTVAVLAVPAPADGWPILDRDAFYGAAGLVVNTLDQYTEADPAALLIDLLAAFGNAVGPSISVDADAAIHTGRLFIVISGDTSKARKGTARAQVRRLMQEAAPYWSANLNVSGLASGEGLIAEFADGDPDPRRFVYEPEFSRTLIASGRRGSTLSPIMRQSYDGVPLQVMTRQPLAAERHHISIVAHITEDELVRSLNAIEMVNGFGNRFMYVAARRSKVRPDGGSAPDHVLLPLANTLAGALQDAADLTITGRTEDARALWHDIYLAEAKATPGLIGALTARAEAHILRLSIIYAVLDGSSVISTEHLAAAKAVWDYSLSSVRWIFSSQTGNPDADRLYRAVEAAGPDGLSGTELRDLFGRHASRERLKQARLTLESLGMIVTCTERTAGPNRRVSYLPRFAPCDQSD